MALDLRALGYDDNRIQELKRYASTLNNSDSRGYGYTSDTSHHFRELDAPSEMDQNQQDMRKISKSMGYEHWGMHNPQRVRDMIAGAEGGDSNGDGGGTPPRDTNKSLKEIADEGGLSPGFIAAAVRDNQYWRDATDGGSTERVYGDKGGPDETEDEYTQRRAFDWLQKYKVDLTDKT